MNIALWIVQALVALAFFVAGFMKAFLPIKTVAKAFQLALSLPLAFVRFIGIFEILGAIGLVLPPLTNILPWLAIAAAVGCILAAGSGMIFHISRRESSVIGVNIVLIILSLFIIFGRVALAPF